jgi:glycosyltransferase involved in cell wall biosynthesis
VSIITPSYNQVEFIEETIRSVLLQGYPNLEYIIMDGGSTDGSVDLICKYEPWLTRWVSEPDQGQTHAINKGWEYATGEILAYINSDDYYLPGAISGAVKGFNASAQAGMIYGSAFIIDKAGKDLRVWKGQKFDLETMLTVGSIVPQPATFFAKHALKKVGYLDERWHIIMDYELCMRIGLQFPTICLPITLAKFRDHLQSKTHAHYEEIAGELIHWLRIFSPPQVSLKEWRRIKRITFSRMHYEWALNYLVKGPEYASKALLQLIESLLQYPLFALKRPMGTAYIIKEILLSYIISIYGRLRLPHRRQQVLRE